MRIPKPLVLDMNLSDKCNLKCKACYAADGAGAGPDMSRTKNTIHWFMKQSTGAKRNRIVKKDGKKVMITEPVTLRRINIYGGEPLLEWESLKETVEWTSGKYPENDFGFTIVTNMTLLTAEKLDWLFEHKVKISPSIDGNPEAQRIARGTDESVFDNVKMMLAKRPSSCRMTVTPATVHLLADSIRFLCDEIGFHTVNSIPAGGVKWTKEQFQIYREQITIATDWYIKRAREGKAYGLYHIRNMVQRLKAGVRRRSLCSAGVNRIAVDTSGNLWPCHRFCNPRSNTEYRLGTIQEGYTSLELVNRIRNFDLRYQFREECSMCPAVLGCHSFCTWETMIQDEKHFMPNTFACELMPHFWQQAMRAYSILSAEKLLGKEEGESPCECC